VLFLAGDNRFNNSGWFENYSRHASRRIRVATVNMAGYSVGSSGLV
jgi:hypothetical protein